MTGLSLLLTACGPQVESGSGTTGLEGTITVSGAFALYPVMIR